MPLYHIQDDQTVEKFPTKTFDRERQLQQLVERNSLPLLGVHFVASEYVTGNRQRGRIDTLGLDENGAPTIVRYGCRPDN